MIRAENGFHFRGVNISGRWLRLLVLRKDQWKSPPIKSQRILVINSWNLHPVEYRLFLFVSFSLLFLSLLIVWKVNFMPAKLIRCATELRGNYVINNCSVLVCYLWSCVVLPCLMHEIIVQIKDIHRLSMPRTETRQRSSGAVFTKPRIGEIISYAN